jgi:hypothetical protein
MRMRYGPVKRRAFNFKAGSNAGFFIFGDYSADAAVEVSKSF